MRDINWDEAPDGATLAIANTINNNIIFATRNKNNKVVDMNGNDMYEYRGCDDWFIAEIRETIVVTKNKDKTELAHQKLDTNDAVNAPSHYSLFENVEAIQLLASSMTEVEFRGYCFGNMLKYRARVGGKDDVNQEIGKANKYKELFTQYRNLCRTTSLFGGTK